MAEQCGCKPDYAFVTHGEDATSVDFCPLHAAATDMLAILEGIGNDILGSLENAAVDLSDGSLLALVRANRAALLGVIGRAKALNA